MWQAIVKGVLGGIGGGMKEAGNSETNLSGGTSATQTKIEEDTAKNAGMLGGKIFSKIKQKKEKDGQKQEVTE